MTRRVGPMYHLDTNCAVAILRGREPVVRERRRHAVGGGVAISSVVLMELWYGVARSARAVENAERLRTFLAGDVEVAPFGGDAAQIAGRLRRTLDAAGTPIGPYDLQIAAHALAAGAIIVTANAREFSRVPELIWEDWSRAVDQ